MLVGMRPPGAFKIAHRPRVVRNGSPSETTSDRTFSTAAALAISDGTDGLGAHAASDLDACLGTLLASDARSQRILASLRNEIVEAGGSQNLRIRLVFREPREIFRLELELPCLGYQRTTLLDRGALEQLLETDEVRAVVRPEDLDL